MNLNLFACSRGGYLVTPECMLASAEALAVHGPMRRFLGVVDCTQFPDEMRRHVEAAVERHAFAFVQQHDGDQVPAIRRSALAAG